MKNYLATHIFKSEEMKKKFMDFVTFVILKKRLKKRCDRCKSKMLGYYGR